jgi:polyisoprenoid-binding protein YceI
MTRSMFIRASVGSALAVLTALTLGAGAAGAADTSPLTIQASKVSLSGTSNVHDYTATTTDVRVTRVQFAAAPGEGFWQNVQKPGALEAFDIAIGAATLKSSKDGLDKNMHKALKVKEHADITFSLKRLEGTAGALKAFGVLRIAGVEREVTLPLTTTQKGDTLIVAGNIDVLMPDFGIPPPKALMGMVKAHPKVTVSFEVVLALATT